MNFVGLALFSVSVVLYEEFGHFILFLDCVYIFSYSLKKEMKIIFILGTFQHLVPLYGIRHFAFRHEANSRGKSVTAYA